MTGQERQELKRMVSEAAKVRVRKFPDVPHNLKFDSDPARQCPGVNDLGSRCNNTTVDPSGFCYAHREKSEARS